MNEINVNGSRVYVENGEVKTILSEDIQNNNGDMTVEQLREILINEVTMIYDMNNDNNRDGRQNK